MRAPIKCNFSGQTFRAVGSRIYWGRTAETDHEFYIRVLQSVLKPGWYKVEINKLPTEQHIVARWYQSYCQWQREQFTVGKRANGIWSAIPSGDAASLLTLAYDLYCLLHCGSLPSSLIRRLKLIDSFQGARYELAVAAIFARLDYKIAWIEDKGRKSCEFIAKHPGTGEVVGVEAKSRHRSGVLHQPGVRKVTEEVKIGISSLLHQALEQKPQGIPFAVFIDVNLPASEAPPQETIWWEDLELSVAGQGEISVENPEQFSILLVTNFAYHYEGRSLLDSKRPAVAMAAVVPRFPIMSFKRVSSIDALVEAVRNYGSVPDAHDQQQPRNIVEQAASVNQMFQFFMPKNNESPKRPPTITSIITCGNLIQNTNQLELRQVGHTVFSKSETGTADFWLYVEGHWFIPGTVEIKITIRDQNSNIVSDPPPIPATVGTNGIFEFKLFLQKHIPFRVGCYEIVAQIKNGPAAMTEVFMIA